MAGYQIRNKLGISNEQFESITGIKNHGTHPNVLNNLNKLSYQQLIKKKKQNKINIKQLNLKLNDDNKETCDNNDDDIVCSICLLPFTNEEESENNENKMDTIPKYDINVSNNTECTHKKIIKNFDKKQETISIDEPTLKEYNNIAK